MSFFSDNNYQVIRNALSDDILQYVKTNFEIHQGVQEFYNPPSRIDPYPFGDVQSPQSFSTYCPIFSESLLVFLKPIVEKITGKRLNESYSYCRNYYKDAELKIHIDRKSCEYSATVCISKDENHPWPIYFKRNDGEILEFELNQGDMVVYRGPILEHWRKPYTGNSHMQVFLHYVDADGPYAKSNKYDGRVVLGLNQNERNPNTP